MQVNVVKGLKMYENIFTEQELSKLNDFVNTLRAAGQNGELLGVASFLLFFGSYDLILMLYSLLKDIFSHDTQL